GAKQYQFYDVLDQTVRTTNGADGLQQDDWDYQGNGINIRTIRLKVDDSFTRIKGVRVNDF
ncbi:MAG: hypothetical protein P8X79_19665, partial [Reinekea sp.]